MLKFFPSDPEYWSQALIALAQITFGIAWGTLFLSFDLFKVFVVVCNILMTFVFLIAGALIRRKK